jgi:hypothetical protein
VLKHLVQKVLSDRYTVIRADQIDDEGLITNQIIEHLLEDELVVADLTDLNPNVFYELAVRHAARKPIVHLISKGQDIPFDVSNMRAVPYALDDPDLLEEAQTELGRKVKAIEDSGFTAAPNPVSAARDVWLLRASEQPEVRQAADLLAGLNQLQDEVRALARRMNQASTDTEVPIAVRVLQALIDTPTPIDDAKLAELAGTTQLNVQHILDVLALRASARQPNAARWASFL